MGWGGVGWRVKAEKGMGVGGGEREMGKEREMGRDVLFLPIFSEMCFWLYTLTNAISFQSTLIKQAHIYKPNYTETQKS